MKKAQTLLLSVIILAALTCISLRGFGQIESQTQDSISKLKIAVDFKRGGYNWYSQQFGFFLGAGINAFIDQDIYSIDYVGMKEYESLLKNKIRFEENYHQISIRKGKFVGSESFRFHYQYGVCVLWGNRRDYNLKINEEPIQGYDYAIEDFISPGIVTRVGFRYYPTKYFGFGGDFETNINLKNVLYYPSVTFEFGNIMKAPKREINGEPKNVLYYEYFGNAIAIYNMGYERIFRLAEKQKFVTGIGIQFIHSDKKNKNPWATFSPQMSFLYGEKHHLETGFGVMLMPVEDEQLLNSMIARVGYRYQRNDGGFMFKAAFTPFFTYHYKKDRFHNFVPWGGIAVGYAF